MATQYVTAPGRAHFPEGWNLERQNQGRHTAGPGHLPNARKVEGSLGGGDGLGGKVPLEKDGQALQNPRARTRERTRPRLERGDGSRPQGPKRPGLGWRLGNKSTSRKKILCAAAGVEGSVRSVMGFKAGKGRDKAVSKWTEGRGLGPASE